MKRLVLLLTLLLTLTGCSTLAPDEYLSVTPHVDSSTAASTADAVTAENYLSLKNAILTMVRTGQTEGIIHVTNYDGLVEEDLAEAAYEVSKLDPLGAYAVDYMTHNCTQIVSYYEIRINITFRRTAREIMQIQSAPTQDKLQNLLEDALNSYDSRLTMRLSSYREQDQEIPAFVADYCAAHVDTIMETPQVSISIYPESGSVRILEIDFLYTTPTEELQSRQKAVEESIDAAAEYIRYREGDLEKAQLLFTYLTGRFSYHREATVSPLYAALCEGVADPAGLAQAWQLICDQAGVECYTVSGMRDGQPYTWNILKTGEYYRHLDLARSITEFGELMLWSDEEMGSYYWNGEELPVCEPEPEPEPAEPVPPAEEPLPPTEEPPAEEPPVEEPPVEEPTEETPPAVEQPQP